MNVVLTYPDSLNSIILNISSFVVLKRDDYYYATPILLLEILVMNDKED